MVNINTITEEELRQDLKESLEDITACEAVLLLGVTSYSGGSVQERLNANNHFVEVISAELIRRGI